MYVKPEVAESLRPADVGWWGHARPFGFEFGDLDYAPGVMRFAGGMPGVPAAHAVAPAYDAILEIGVARLRERSLSMTQPLLVDALSPGFTVRPAVDPH